MKLSNFWSNLLVTYNHLRNAFSDAQDGDRAIVADHGLTKILSGFAVTEDPGGPSLSVEVAPGLAHDKAGARLRSVDAFAASFAADENDLSTEVLSTLNERWLSLFLRVARVETDPQGPDLLGHIVNFQSFEGVDTFCVPGVEAPIGTATRPALDDEAILLCDVLLSWNQTTIANADLDFTRTEIMLDTPAATGTRPFTKKFGDALEAIYELYVAVNDLAAGAAPVQYTGGVRAWANADPVYTASPQSVTQCLIDLPAGLAMNSGGGTNGAVRVGSFRINVGSVLISTGTVWSQLTALADATNHSMPAAGNFSATTTAGWLTALTTTAGATTNGAYFVGAFAHGNFTGANVYAQLAELDGVGAGDDGAKRVKTEAVGGLAGSTVRAQLNELDTGWGKLARSNTWTLPQTLTAPSPGNMLVLTGTDSKAQFGGEVVCLDGLAVNNGTLNYFSTGTAVTATFNGPVVVNGAAGGYPSLTNYVTETRDFLNIHVTNTATMTFSLSLGTLACISSGTITAAKLTWVELTLPISAIVSAIEVTWIGNITGAALTPATYEVISIAGSPDVNPTTFTRTALSAVVVDTNAATFLVMNTQAVALTSGSFTVDPLKRYFVVIQHYYDAAGCQSEIHRVRATLTPGKLRPR